MFDDFADLGLQTGSGDILEAPDQGWTDSDREFMAPCLGLVKVAKAYLKKVSGAVKARGKCDCGESISQLDNLGQLAKWLSPVVDDVVAALYPPLNHAAVTQGVSVCGRAGRGGPLNHAAVTKGVSVGGGILSTTYSSCT